MLKIEAYPALMASRGKTGVVEAADYRGKKVLAAYSFIPRTRWGFVAKQDQQEIYASIPKLFFSIFIIFLMSAGVVIFIAFFVAGNITKPIVSMVDVSRKIQAGTEAVY